MDDKQFDKRMELLKKSYERLEPQLNPEDVFAQIEAEEKENKHEPTPSPKQPSRWQKPAVWAASVASVLLVGMLVVPYVSDLSTSSQQTEENIKEHNDKWLEEFKKTYETKREQMRKELDMPEEEFAKLTPVRMADSSFHDLEKTKERVQSNDNSNSDYLESEQTYILGKLSTPGEIIEWLEDIIELYGGHNEAMAFEESSYYFKLYAKDAEELALYYTKQLTSYSDVLFDEPGSYPKELKELIATANRQYIELQNDGQQVQFRPNPVFSNLAPSYMEHLHPDVLGYFKYLATGSLLVGGDLRVSPNEAAAILATYEQTLITEPATEGTDFAVLKGEYENTWLALFKDTIDFPMRLADGQLNPEYMDFLARVADGEYGMAMQNTAEKITSELKTGKSLTQMQLTAYDVWMGVLQKRYDGTNFTQNGATTVILDDSWILQAQRLHDTYVKTGETKVIDTLQPLNVVSLFLYALSQENYKTAQQLIVGDVDITVIPKFNDMLIFSELSETDGSTITVTAMVKERERDKYGHKIIFKIDPVKNEAGESGYRISAINQ